MVMPITEIENAKDAEERINAFFKPTKYVKNYGDISVFLSKPSASLFEKALEEVSAGIWAEYLEYGDGINRFTRSIIRFANRNFGFDIRENIVFTGPLTDEDFTSVVAKGTLWKDTFAPEHGEFSHTFQWLAAGHGLKLGAQTAELFRMSTLEGKVELCAPDGTGTKMVKKISPLWGWLVDCFNYRESLDTNKDWDPVRNIYSAGSYRVPNNVNTLLRNRPEWFIGHYVQHRHIHKLDAAIQTASKDPKIFESSSASLKNKDLKNNMKAIRSFQTKHYQDKSAEMWSPDGASEEVYRGQDQVKVNRIYSRPTDLKRPNQVPMEKKTFHGMTGLVPKSTIM
jgi:hypothetical protein